MRILNLNDIFNNFKSQISKEQYAEMKAVNEVYPVKISEYYAKLAFQNAAAFKQAFPSKDELTVNKFSKVDPLDEEPNQIIPGLIHKYKNKAIVLTTNLCFMNCRHCTRKRIMHGQFHYEEPDYNAIFNYLKKHTEINDVLLTGGDVLSLNDDYLIRILEQLKQIEHINSIRLGTRAPVTCPQRIHSQLFERIAQFQNVLVNTQFNHPCEITEESIEACNIIQNSGIPICNQTVVLKGINDNYFILRELFLKLINHRIIPYYLYQCDNVTGVSHFITSPRFGAEVIKKLRTELPGIAVPRYTIDTQDEGKIIAEYGNIVFLTENRAELTTNDGKLSITQYEISSPKNE